MNEPIFIHGSARTGSTFVYNALRKDKSLMVFNEAIIDGKRDYMDLPKTWEHSEGWVNQAFLGTEPDYVEFLEAREAFALCPEYPSFQGFTFELYRYIAALIRAAQDRGRRPVFCEINSRPLARRLKLAFGGHHVTQVRNPVSQFGSFVRALIEGKTWGFLAQPIMELAYYPPEYSRWPVPVYRRNVSSRGAHWRSDARYIAFAARQKPEDLFRWHFLSWAINNSRAMEVSDAVLDIDNPSQCLPVPVDWTGYKRFDRFYSFDFSYSNVIEEVLSARAFMGDPYMAAAYATVDLSGKWETVSDSDWRELQRSARKLWHNPVVGWAAGLAYPIVAPIGRRLRIMGAPL